MSERKKYVMATIKIPLEIASPESYQPLSKLINITLESINELPETQDGDFNDESIEKQILNFLNNSVTKENIVENKAFVSKDEIKLIKKSPKKNMTFRNKNHSTSKYTLKN